MVSYSYRQTSLLYSVLRYYDDIITIRVFLTRLQWHEANVLDNWQLAELPQSGGREFDLRRVHDNLTVPLWVYMRFPAPEHQNQTKQICISPAPGRSSKLKHSVFQLSLGHVIGIVFLIQFQWHEANVLDNWQLAELPQPGGREFDPRRVHDNLSVPLWVYLGFPVPEHQNQTKQIYVEPKWIHRPCLLYFTTFFRTGS